jgi:CHAT domain-containing protein
MGKQVEFLICGAQKGGTTALHGYLQRHPQLYLPNQKELHYFDNEDKNWENPNYEIYHQHFADAKTEQQLLGEATPIYMYWNSSPARIWQYNPRIKLIAMLRNPITRAFSHWNMERERKADGMGFLEAITTETARCRGALPLQHRVYSYVDRGFYSQQLRRLWNYFPQKQVLVLRQEQLQQNPGLTMEQIYKHLGIVNVPFTGAQQLHALPYEDPMPAAAKDWLRQHFLWEIKQLEAMLGWDCRNWLEE